MTMSMAVYAGHLCYVYSQSVSNWWLTNWDYYLTCILLSKYDSLLTFRVISQNTSMKVVNSQMPTPHMDVNKTLAVFVWRICPWPSIYGGHKRLCDFIAVWYVCPCSLTVYCPSAKHLRLNLIFVCDVSFPSYSQRGQTIQLSSLSHLKQVFCLVA